MYPVPKQMDKVVIFRPGALGDVLAVRGAIRLIRSVLPDTEICLLAPGERGRLFHRAGWADRWYDSDRAAFSWLDSSGESQPQPALSAVFGGCDWFISYAGTAGNPEAVHTMEHRVAELAPATATVFCPSEPPAGHVQPIGEWLANAAASFCAAFDLVEPGTTFDLPALAASKLTVPDAVDCPWRGMGRYVVLHPGSGSVRKNWPLDHFVEIGAAIQRLPTPPGIVVTSGEADGDRGSRLAEALNARHVHSTALPVVAALLAHAAVYVGNDSGISHLAAAVATEDGRSPRVVTVFGASDPAVWAPPGALVLDAGPGMDSLPAGEAWEKIAPILEDTGE